MQTLLRCVGCCSPCFYFSYIQLWFISHLLSATFSFLLHSIVLLNRSLVACSANFIHIAIQPTAIFPQPCSLCIIIDPNRGCVCPQFFTILGDHMSHFSQRKGWLLWTAPVLFPSSLLFSIFPPLSSFTFSLLFILPTDLFQHHAFPSHLLLKWRKIYKFYCKSVVLGSLWKHCYHKLFKILFWNLPQPG